MPDDTKEQRQRYIAALLRERSGAAAGGKDARVEAIDAELKRVGHEAKPPAKRAETREAKQPDGEKT